MNPVLSVLSGGDGGDASSATERPAEQTSEATADNDVKPAITTSGADVFMLLMLTCACPL